MIIYSDSPVSDYWLSQSNLHAVNHFPEYLNDPGPKKAVFHAPFPRHNDFNDLVRIFDSAYDSSDQLILLVSELHDVTVDFIEKYDKPKIVYFLNGDLNFKISHAQVRRWDHWFDSTTTFYKNNIFLLDKLIPYQPKTHYFDILLGQSRSHRTQIFDYINENKLNDQVIMTYMTTLHQGLQDRNDSEWLWETEGVEIPNWPMRHTILKIKYFNQMVSLSQIIPISIYNQTAYSIVAETWGTDNRFTFNTEKIVKPILAERLFLVSSNQYYLRNLRNMGFKTFDGIIDESYDLEPDYVKRCNMVCQQIKYLLSQPQEKILEEIQHITKHNRNLMLVTDWQENVSRDFKEILLR